MLHNFFKNIFQDMDAPVIICKNILRFPLVFVNVAAKLLLNPMMTIENIDADNNQPEKLENILRFAKDSDESAIMDALKNSGRIKGYNAQLLSANGEPIQILLSANLIRLEEAEYLIFYLWDKQTAKDDIDIGLMFTIFHASYQTENLDEAINRILGIAGSNVHVDRAYIFEEISDTMTRNTYEWCAEGVEPAIQDLQYLNRNDYGYDEIIESGVFIAGDIMHIPDRYGRDILAVQGIKSLAILPLYHLSTPLGYVGFDDCTSTREWSQPEISLLKFIANVVESLLVRRKAEEKVANSLNALQTITDNNAAIIYVNDISTYEIVFANRQICDTLHIDHKDIIGKICWQVLQKDMDGPCSFCPMKHMLDENGEQTLENYQWEFQNTHTEKWYLVHDNIIKWVDGRSVHIENATDITAQKEQEEKLKYYASTDAMTSVYNREWGYKIIDVMLKEARLLDQPISLCFIDLDGLKNVNDTMGHSMGDELILSIVRILQSHIRKNDIICRWGGDEFLLIMRCTTDETKSILRKILASVEKENDKGTRPFLLSFSYGITDMLDPPDATMDDIISRADKLMYNNKMAKRQD